MSGKNKILAAAVAVAVIACAASAAWYFTKHKQQVGQVEHITHTTDAHETFIVDAPPADARFVGEWRNEDNPDWHRVYYDDYEDEGFYWGKEWHEDENIEEGDLVFHGNGWFLWKVEDNILHELHCMDGSEVKVPKNYRFEICENNKLTLTDKTFKDTAFRFKRQEE